VTGFLLLSESHLSVHTFPERGFAAFDLYCCRERAPWAWDRELLVRLGARDVRVRSIARGGEPS
jgi:S-adenosylmethionine decarboxylase